MNDREILRQTQEITSVTEPESSLGMARIALAGTESSTARIAAHEANMKQKNKRLRANAKNITLFEQRRRSRLDITE